MGIEEFSRIQGSNARPSSVNFESPRIDSAITPVPLVQPSAGGGATSLDSFMGNDFWAMFGGDTFSQSAQKQPKVKATVQKGDDIEKIVRAQYKDEIDKVAIDENKEKFIKAKVAQVEKANKLKKDYILMVGQELVMPGLKKPEETPAVKATTDEKLATPSESSTPASKEEKEVYKLVQDDTLSKIVMDKYFDGKNPGKDKLMTKVGELAKINGIEEKDYTKLAIGREIKFSEDSTATAEVKSQDLADKPQDKPVVKHAKTAKSAVKPAEAENPSKPEVASPQRITTKLSNGHTVDVSVGKDGRRIVEEFYTQGKDQRKIMVSRDVTNSKAGAHTEYNIDGSIKDVSKIERSVSQDGRYEDKYTDADGKRIYRQYDKDGNLLNTIVRKEKTLLGDHATIVSDKNGWISTDYKHFGGFTDSSKRSDGFFKRHSLPTE